MNTLPPDWNDDRKLWDVLGKTPSQRPPSNFAYMVRKQLDAAPATTKRARFSPFAWLKASPFQGFTFGLSAIAACVMLLVFLGPQPAQKTSAVKPITVASNDTEDFTQVAPHVELIQDLDVIEHLDEL